MCGTLCCSIFMSDLELGAWLSAGDGSPSQLSGGVSVEHDVVVGRVQCPVVSFTRIVVGSWYFHEALVQREIVSDCVLPALLVLVIVRKVFQDVVVYAAQCELSFRTGANCHYNQNVVGERRLLEFLLFLAILRIFVLLDAILCGLCVGAGRDGFFELGCSVAGFVHAAVRVAILHRSCIPGGGAGGCASRAEFHVGTEARDGLVGAVHLSIRFMD